MRWVARQGGAHHVPPCKRTFKMTKVLLTVGLFLKERKSKNNVGEDELDGRWLYLTR